MAALPGLPMDEFLSKYPSVIREWIEQDLGWKVDEVKNILIEDSCDYFPYLAIKVTVTKKTGNDHTSAQAEFVKDFSDNWQMAKEGLEI